MGIVRHAANHVSEPLWRAMNNLSPLQLGCFFLVVPQFTQCMLGTEAWQLIGFQCFNVWGCYVNKLTVQTILTHNSTAMWQLCVAWWKLVWYDCSVWLVDMKGPVYEYEQLRTTGANVELIITVFEYFWFIVTLHHMFFLMNCDITPYVFMKTDTNLW